jgi:hypothetical protein
MASPLTNLLIGIPQTQSDINVLAQTAGQFQSPQVQAQIAKARDELETYLVFQGITNFISTAALVGIFILLWKKR